MWGNYLYSCKSHCIICQMTKQLNWLHAKVKMLAPRKWHREFGQSNCVPSPAALQGEPWEWLKKLRTERLPTNKVAAWIWICIWSFCSALIRYPLVSLPYLFLLFPFGLRLFCVHTELNRSLNCICGSCRVSGSPSFLIWASVLHLHWSPQDQDRQLRPHCDGTTHIYIIKQSNTLHFIYGRENIFKA